MFGECGVARTRGEGKGEGRRGAPNTTKREGTAGNDVRGDHGRISDGACRKEGRLDQLKPQSASPRMGPGDLDQAVVLFDFIGQTEELDVVSGDVLTIWERSNAEWWWATINGRDFGFVPKNYLQLLEK